MPPPQFAPYHQDRFANQPQQFLNQQQGQPTPPLHDKGISSPITPATPSSAGSNNGPFNTYQQETKPQAPPAALKSPSESSGHHQHGAQFPRSGEDSTTNKYEGARSPPGNKHPYHYQPDGLIMVARNAQDAERHERSLDGMKPYQNERVFFPSDRHLDQRPTAGKAPEHSKSPSGTLSPRTQASVHMGVVQGPPFTMAQREAIQTGQVRIHFKISKSFAQIVQPNLTIFPEIRFSIGFNLFLLLDGKNSCYVASN